VKRTENKILFTHAAVRLRAPDSIMHKQWTLENLLERTVYTVSPIVAMVIISFIGGEKISNVLYELNQYVKCSKPDILKTINFFYYKNILVKENDKKNNFALSIMKEWTNYGWIEAADYYLSTFDYPFLDYSKEGIERDSLLMKKYRSEEHDFNRTKRYDSAQHRIYTQKASDSLKQLSSSFNRAWFQYSKSKNENLQRLTLERLKLLTSITFGKLRSRKMYDDKCADLIRKTSPSGGSRHPTEGYIFALNIESLQPGIYHFSVADNSLEMINKLPNQKKLESLFEGLYRSRQERGFEPEALLILTSVFERNMYRYREPRTFRTIFMDVGHLSSTFEFTAVNLGLQCYFQHGVIDEKVEKLLHIRGLSEGIIYGAALAGKNYHD